MKGKVSECEVNFKLLGKYEKGKIVVVHAMKACMESRVTAALILNTRHQMEVGGHLHVQVDLPPRIEFTLSVELDVRWVPEPVWTFCRREKFLDHALIFQSMLSMCICLSYLYLFYLMCICCTMCVLLFLL